MKRMELTQVSMGDFLDSLPSEAESITDELMRSTDIGAWESILILLHSLKSLVGYHLKHAPIDEESILALCGTWFDAGMLIGRDPDRLKEMLLKIKAKVIESEGKTLKGILLNVEPQVGREETFDEVLRTLDMRTKPIGGTR